MHAIKAASGFAASIVMLACFAEPELSVLEPDTGTGTGMSEGAVTRATSDEGSTSYDTSPTQTAGMGDADSTSTDPSEAASGETSSSGSSDSTDPELSPCDALHMDCEACAKCAISEGQACADEWSICKSHVSCLSFIPCFDQCHQSSDTQSILDACIEMCSIENPEGSHLFEQLSDCGDVECAVSCS